MAHYRGSQRPVLAALQNKATKDQIKPSRSKTKTSGNPDQLKKESLKTLLPGNAVLQQRVFYSLVDNCQ